MVYRLMLHHHPMLHSYNTPHEQPILKINEQRHGSNILNDPPQAQSPHWHKISSKIDNLNY